MITSLLILLPIFLILTLVLFIIKISINKIKFITIAIFITSIMSGFIILLTSILVLSFENDYNNVLYEIQTYNYKTDSTFKKAHQITIDIQAFNDYLIKCKEFENTFLLNITYNKKYSNYKLLEFNYNNIVNNDKS